MWRPLLVIAMLLLNIPNASAADWLQFRGPGSTSVAADPNVPTAWSEADTLAWKISLPGKGLSSPIIVGSKIFVTAASGFNQDRLHVLCFDVKTSKKLWERQFWATGSTMCHPKTHIAASTPASDGQFIYALFSSNDVVCLDLDGNLQWLRGLTLDYPNCRNSLGMASSPLVVGKTLIVQIENDSQSLAVGLDIATGQNRWKLDRPISANWTSPTLLTGNSPVDTKVLLQSAKGLIAIHPDTGKEVWTYDQGCNTIPSSTVVDGIVYVPSAGLTALQVESGSPTPKVLWSSAKLAPSTPSPLIADQMVFGINKIGVLTAGDIKTGDIKWQLRLTGAFWGTPAVASGHLFLVNDAGLAQIVKPGDTSGEVVSTFDFKQPVLSSPIIVDGAVYIRSESTLWKMARK